MQTPDFIDDRSLRALKCRRFPHAFWYGTIGFVLCGFLMLQEPARAQTAEESQVKASYLFNFAKYVEWPPDASRGVEDPTVICVVGDERTASVLEQVTAGRKANGRRVEIRRPRSTNELKNCHILFIAFQDKARIVGTLRHLLGANVLVVGQSDQFIALGGMINLDEKHETIELEIDPRAAEAAGLKISSRLLEVSHIVGGERTGRNPQ